MDLFPNLPMMEGQDKARVINQALTELNNWKASQGTVMPHSHMSMGFTLCLSFTSMQVYRH
jgi:O-phosphoseryl-tRNA(Cys) synthetase